MITDNLSLLHIADPDTQRSVEEIGLRLLQRVSVKGRYAPSKTQRAYTLQEEEQSKREAPAKNSNFGRRRR